MVRELREELGVTVRAARPLGEFPHDYPDRSVCIGLWLVSAWEGEPQGLDGQALRWVALPAACRPATCSRPTARCWNRCDGPSAGQVR